MLMQDCLSPLSMQALPAPSESLCIVEMGGTEAKEETGETGTVGGLYLNIGLQVRTARIMYMRVNLSAFVCVYMVVFQNSDGQIEERF